MSLLYFFRYLSLKATLLHSSTQHFIWGVNFHSSSSFGWRK